MRNRDLATEARPWLLQIGPMSALLVLMSPEEAASLPAPPVQPVVQVTAVGDLQLGDSPICVGFGFDSRHGESGLDRTLQSIRPLLTQGDVTFGNLETTLSRAGLVPGNASSAQLRGRPGYAEALQRAGFNILNVANNHATQHGLAAFLDTIELLERSNIMCCGVRGSSPWASQPAILSLSGKTRVGVLGYCQRPRQYSREQPPYAEGTGTEILADVERLSPEVDHVLVSLHWGEEFVDRPSEHEVSLARAIIDSGASAVLGHHPHVVRPIERYRDGLIAYSLGNLIGDMLWQDTFRQGVIVQLSLTQSGVGSVRTARTYLDEDYCSIAASPGASHLVADHPVAGLPEQVYAREVSRTVRSQRLAAYRYALASLGKYPAGALGQLALTTLRNKLAALLRRA